MSLGSDPRRSFRRAQLSLLLLLALPLAAAQTLPLDPALPTAPTPAAPGAEALPDGSLDIDEGGLVFRGMATDPALVRVTAPDGAPVFEYARDAQGRARVDVAGGNVISDATLLAVVGAPTSDAFTLYVRDADGNVHTIEVDRAALAANAPLPEDQQAPAVDVLRPPTWPRAPSAPFLVYVEDEGGSHVAAAKLDGAPFLRRLGEHTVGLQVPVAEADFTRIHVEARRTGQATGTGADFARVRATDDAVVYEATFDAAHTGAKDGEEIELQVLYERRTTPLLVERFPESLVYAYRVDGTSPTLQLVAPAEAGDFRFTVTWSGSDAFSGLAGVTIDQREAGAAAWTPWLTRSAPRSATFSGAWGKTYELRAVAFDAVGNPSAPAYATTRIAAAASPPPSPPQDVNDPPSAAIGSPASGTVLAGAVSVLWSAGDPDGAAVTSKLELSPDNGRTWRLLSSGVATAASWDTRGDADGDGYRLRLTVSDGALQDIDEVSGLVVRNVVAPQTEPAPRAPSAPGAAAPPSPSAPAQPGGADGPASAAGEKDVPAPFAAAVLLLAALLARRRRA